MRNTRVGDWVEVRSKEEILETLDGSGHLDGMPFMPEMFAFSGKRFRVHKRAHKTCDTVFPIRGRWVDRSVHLETRCDGSAHGGCQAGCLIFWKEAWLKRINVDESDKARYDAETNVPDVRRPAPTRCAEATVWDAAKVSDRDGGPTTYVCQATRLPYSTRPLAWWDVRQYLEDYWSGNVGIGRLISGLIYSMYYNLSQAGIGVGPAMRWLYNRSRWLWRGSLFPRTPGAIPMGQPTPTGALNLQPGELVRVKPHEEILRTLSTDNRNRGLLFDAELVPYCGGTYRVLTRVTRILDEKSGQMQAMKHPCIVLESVTCEARYSACRMFCPRAIYPYWREIWLERVGPAAAAGGEAVTLGRQTMDAGQCGDVGAHQHARG